MKKKHSITIVEICNLLLLAASVIIQLFPYLGIIPATL